MPEDNVERVRRAVEALNRHDAQALQALCAPDVEFVPLRAAMEDTVYRGPDAIAEAFRDFDESWESLSFEVEELRSAGDRVVAITRMRARGRASGVSLDQAVALVATLRGGKFVSMRSHSDVNEALKAVGLAE